MKNAFILVSVVAIEIAVFLSRAPLTNPVRLLTTDFVNFYVAASIIENGSGASLYHRETQDAAFRAILGHASNQYFLHPPFEAAALSPIARLNLSQAFLIWLLINVALLGSLPLILMRCVPLVARRPYLPLLGFCFLPVFIALALGQDSIVLLFAVSSAYLLLTKGKDVNAGLVLTVATVKLQYLLVLAPLLIVLRKWRFALGFVTGCAALAVISMLVTGGVHGLAEYFRFVHNFNAHAGFGGLNTALMVNLRGFLAGTGHAAHWGRYSVAAGVILFVLGIACSHSAASEKSGLVFGLFLSSALVAAPYAHFPDATLMLLPILLALDYVVSARRSSISELIALSCACIFFLPMVLLIFSGVFWGGFYWWNGRVYLLFPVIVIFIGLLAAELFMGRTTRRFGGVSIPASPPTKGSSDTNRKHHRKARIL
jgi:hypothetical protein